MHDRNILYVYLQWQCVKERRLCHLTVASNTIEAGWSDSPLRHTTLNRNVDHATRPPRLLRPTTLPDAPSPIVADRLTQCAEKRLGDQLRAFADGSREDAEQQFEIDDACGCEVAVCSGVHGERVFLLLHGRLSIYKVAGQVGNVTIWECMRHFVSKAFCVSAIGFHQRHLGCSWLSHQSLAMCSPISHPLREVAVGFFQIHPKSVVGYNAQQLAPKGHWSGAQGFPDRGRRFPTPRRVSEG